MFYTFEFVTTAKSSKMPNNSNEDNNNDNQNHSFGKFLK